MAIQALSATPFHLSLINLHINDASSDCHDQLLADVRHRICPQPKSVLGVPKLDDLLESFRYPDEPASRLPEWVSSGTPSPEYHADQEEYDYSEGLNVEIERSETQLAKSKPATIEITSRQSASGKTNLLYYLAALATLPHEVDGKQSAVVWIDNDGRFLASRLSQVVRHHLFQISSATDTTGEEEQDTTNSRVIEALTHIHVFQPHSSSQVLSILESLPSYLLDQTRHKSSLRPLGLLVIDSATAFYAQDRFDADMARLDAPLRQHSTGNHTSSKTAAIIARLKEIQARFECAVLFATATTTTTNTNNNNSLPNQPPHELPSNPRPGSINPTTPTISPWTSFATLTLQVERVRVPQFVPRMTLAQCLDDAERRLEVVRRGRFLVSVVPKSLDVGAKGKAKDVENIVLRVTEDGVVVI